MPAIHHKCFAPFAIAIMNAGPLANRAHVVTSTDESELLSGDYIIYTYYSRASFARDLRYWRKCTSQFAREWMQAADYARIAFV